MIWATDLLIDGSGWISFHKIVIVGFGSCGYNYVPVHSMLWAIDRSSGGSGVSVGLGLIQTVGCRSNGTDWPVPLRRGKLSKESSESW
jgi:hypothetical protein